MGTARMVPSGWCLRPRSSWLVPVLVHAAPVRGAARVKVSRPQPQPGQAAFGCAQGDGFFGAQRGVV